MASHMFKVGDFKNANLKSGESVCFRIIGFKHDITPDGMSCAVTFDLADCLPNRYRMNDRDTNQGSWEKMHLRHELNDKNGQIYKLIPDEIIELAEPVVKLTADTRNGENAIIKTVDKFFLLSEKELYGRHFGSVSGEGKWYEYYRQEDVAWHKTRNGDRDHVWLRSPNVNIRSYFCIVATGGGNGCTIASTARGVSFGFSF